MLSVTPKMITGRLAASAVIAYCATLKMIRTSGRRPEIIAIVIVSAASGTA